MKVELERIRNALEAMRDRGWSATASAALDSLDALEKQIGARVGSAVTEAEERGRKAGYQAATKDFRAWILRKALGALGADIAYFLDFGDHVGGAERAKGGDR